MRITDRPRAGFVFRTLSLLAFAALPVGCSSHPPTQPHVSITPTTAPLSTDGLFPSAPITAVETMSAVPIGWTAQPLKHSSEHDHQIWLSPSGSTAYGVIRFHNILLPVTPDRLVLDKFLESMKKSEGEATLVSVQDEPQVGGLRFVAEGGLYRIRSILKTRGTAGWVIYAGTVRARPVNDEELTLAERAREHTEFGISKSTVKN